MASSLKTFVTRACAASAVAFFAGTAHADESWASLPVIDMTAQASLGGDMLITTGFLHDLNVVSYGTPVLQIAPDGQSIETVVPARETGWSGIVEVDLEDDQSLPIQNASAFSDTFAEDERETRMSGFYTMRYQFESQTPFRPYAGAGLGVVALGSSSDTSGVVAGRATAGFDLSLGTQAALYAEYAFVKSGGVSLGSGAVGVASIPDTEHSVTLGFRRSF